MVKKTADVSIQNMCEHISQSAAAVTFGGAKIGFQLVRVFPSYEKNSHTVRGPQLCDLEGAQPLGLIINICPGINTFASARLFARDLEAVIEKKIGDFMNQISGVTHQNTRDRIEIVVGKKAIADGLTFEEIGEDLKELIIEQFSFVENVFVTFITDDAAAEIELSGARRIYDERDARALSLHDEDVSVFYGCRICQISCPAHVCVITPDRPSVCGTINWFEAGAAYASNPDGPVFEIQKGDLRDEKAGAYQGVNDAIKIESGGEVDEIFLYSLTEKPHTTGASFDIVAFYIPEADGIGLMDRETKTESVIGVSFEELSMYTGYGQQIPGFSGVGETYLLSPKFLQNDGGWRRVAWISESLKNRLLPKIHDKELLALVSSLPTEQNAKNTKELTLLRG